MKKLHLFILLASVFTLFISCEKENDVAEDPQEEITLDDLIKDGDYKYTEGDVKHMSPEEMADQIYGDDPANAAAKAEFLKNCSVAGDSVANEIGQNASALFFGTRNFTYMSVDETGKPIELSAFLGWGEYRLADKYFPMTQERIRLVCPYTHTLESECATASNGGYEFMLTTSNDLFIMPDGEGFGASRDRDQMYLNHDLQARQIYDALCAGYSIYINDVKGKLSKKWTLRVFGASQGAADAIAVHRMLDTETVTSGGSTKTLGEMWNFEHSFVCCGPYSPATTVEEYYKLGYVYFPIVLPLTIKSMLHAYPEFEARFPEERFYTEEYLKLKDDMDKYLRNNDLATSELNSICFDNLQVGDEKGNNYLRLERILSAEARDTNSQLYKDFMACLDKQDLTKGWTPRTKTYIYHCKKDEVVPWANSQKLISFFGDKCRTYELFIEGHMNSCIQFFITPW